MTATDSAAAREQHRTPYADALLRHRDRVLQRFMIPGHSANQHGGAGRLEQFLGQRALSLDIPQMIRGIDIGEDHAYGEAKALAAKAWGARSSWFLTNGASQGNRMALMAARALGDRVLVQRSSHSSVYDGLVMSGLVPVYAMPEIDRVHRLAHGVTPREIEERLNEAMRRGQPVASVVIVSPSYFGAVAEIRAIARICHEHGAALIVDASWGAHFGFHPEVPESPTRLGADVVISSIHKLGGSLTQSAMLHLTDGARAPMLEAALDAAYLLTESTSLSSLLLASLDIARSELATGQARIEESLAAAAELRRLVNEDSVLELAEAEFRAGDGVVEIDPLHVSIDVRATGLTGMQLKHELGVGPTATFVEIATPTTLVALVGALSAPDTGALIEAIHQVMRAQNGRRLETGGGGLLSATVGPPAPGEIMLTPREAYLAPHETVAHGDAVGRVAADMLAAYPPGIPNVVPGEIITAEAVAYLRDVAAAPGGHVRGALDPALERIRVCARSTGTE